MRIRLTAIALACALAAPHALAAPGPRKPKVAVLEVKALGTDAQKAELLSEIALTEAASFPELDVIGRSDIVSMLGFERERKLLGCTEESSCLAEIGGALGVDYVLVGSLGKLGAVHRIDVKLVDARRSRVTARVGESVSGDEAKLVSVMQSAVKRLLAPVVAAAPPAPAAATKPPAPKPALAAGPQPGAGAASAATVSKAATPAPDAKRRTWALATGGTGLALLAGGVVMGVLANSAYQAEKDAAASGDLAGYESNKAAAKNRALAADVLYVTGAVSLGVGTYLWYTGGRTAVTVTPLEGGALAAVSGRF